MPVTDKKATIDALQQGLKKFLVDTIEAEKFDIVIPIMRKGFFLLETLFPEHKEFDIFLPDTLPEMSLSDKRILILDDSARTGGTINKEKQRVLEKATNKNNPPTIRLAVFLKHKACGEPIDHYYKEYDDNNQTIVLKEQLSDYFDSLCHQLDPDHLVIRVEIGKNQGEFIASEFLDVMREILKQKGTYYEQNSVCTLWRRNKFAVCDLNPTEFGLERFAKYWITEGVCKARFCFEQNDIVPNSLFIVPMFYPKVIPPQGKECQRVIAKKFCDLSANHASGKQCVHCVNFVLTAEFAKNLITQLKREIMAKGFTVNITSVSWLEIELRDKSLRPALFSDFEDFFK